MAQPQVAERLRFVKGHGTQNDFVILTDPAAALDLTEPLVTALCDRRRGIGADGLLRVVRSAALVERGVLDALPDGVGPDDWFMDYRNADGSIAEMCGNGVRVFAHHLRAAGLMADDQFVVGSRAGARPVIVHSHDAVHADVTVEMVMGNMKANADNARRFVTAVLDALAEDEHSDLVQAKHLAGSIKFGLSTPQPHWSADAQKKLNWLFPGQF